MFAMPSEKDGSIGGKEDVGNLVVIGNLDL
jgi:hypothetical protein